MARYSQQLEGKALADGWQIVKRIDRQAGQTGGCFSDSYLVERADGHQGFLKAIDLSAAVGAQDPTAVLKPLIDAYEFERALLFECRERAMSHVVLPLASGSIRIDESVPFSNVPYIIFERGDGDIRLLVAQTQWLEAAWALRALHHIAVGLSQLHRANVAHQDLKPSNVVVFGNDRNKVGDLGHAVRRDAPLVRPEHNVIGGDPAHAPPEQLYLDVPTDWVLHRVGADLYHLGSLAVFFFGRTTMTALLRLHIPQSVLPGKWRGSYAEILPVVRDAYSKAITQFAAEVPAELRKELVTIVQQLCDPDPSQRGHPLARAAKHGDPLSLERYVSQFNRLAATVSRRIRVATQ